MLMTDNVGYLCNNHVSNGSLKQSRLNILAKWLQWSLCCSWSRHIPGMCSDNWESVIAECWAAHRQQYQRKKTKYNRRLNCNNWDSKDLLVERQIPHTVCACYTVQKVWTFLQCWIICLHISWPYQEHCIWLSSCRRSPQCKTLPLHLGTLFWTQMMIGSSRQSALLRGGPTVLVQWSRDFDQGSTTVNEHPLIRQHRRHYSLLSYNQLLGRTPASSPVGVSVPPAAADEQSSSSMTPALVVRKKKPHQRQTSKADNCCDIIGESNPVNTTHWAGCGRFSTSCCNCYECNSWWTHQYASRADCGWHGDNHIAGVDVWSKIRTSKAASRQTPSTPLTDELCTFMDLLDVRNVGDDMMGELTWPLSVSAHCHFTHPFATSWQGWCWTGTPATSFTVIRRRIIYACC